jgi:tripartite-type tricarboxylate transporter receptor subunit TctC
MRLRTLLSGSICVALLALGGTAAARAAETFPTKPIHLIIPVAPGGSIDIVSRLIGQKMGEFLGQPVLIENRGGAETLLAVRYVKNQPADGYTIMAAANGFLTMSALKLDPGYDPLGDFSGLGLMETSPMIIETGASQPEKTLTEVTAFGKANPGKLTYASGGLGTPTQVAVALYLQKAGVEATHVLYKGNGAALPDIAGGRVNLICDGYISSLAYYTSHTIRPLAVTGETRMTVLPDVPTLKEQGIDLSYTLWLGLLTRRGTPPEVIHRLSDAIRFATSSKDIIDRFHGEGSEPGNDTPEQFDAFLAKDMAISLPRILSLNIPKE